MLNGPDGPDFSGNFRLVTGATQCVGVATALMLAEAGPTQIAFCGRQEEAGAALEARLASQGLEAPVVAADLAEFDAAFAEVDATIERFSGVDMLENVAGATDRGTLETTSPETWGGLSAVNARALFFLAQRAVPSMTARGGGSTVNVISIAAHGGAPSSRPMSRRNQQWSN